MDKYIGQVGEKITIEAIFKKTFEYQTHYTFYGETHTIHIFEDDEGNIIKWDTTGILEDRKYNKEHNFQPIYIGSKVRIKATIKELAEYKGTKQTVITRPTFTIIELGKSPEQIAEEIEKKKEQKKQEQLDSLTGEDFLWEMPYKQYKEHYSDCETLYDSYKDNSDRYTKRPATIVVIIRGGRLKASGVRGEHFSGYKMTNENGEWITYRAVSEENAMKRVKKDFPEHTWECTKVYNYR